MIPMIDITGDVCPMTFVKVKMALDNIAPSGKLNVLLKEEALKSVISSLKAEGHSIEKVVGRVDLYLLVVERGGAKKQEPAR